MAREVATRAVLDDCEAVRTTAQCRGLPSATSLASSKHTASPLGKAAPLETSRNQRLTAAHCVTTFRQRRAFASGLSGRQCRHDAVSQGIAVNRHIRLLVVVVLNAGQAPGAIFRVRLLRPLGDEKKNPAAAGQLGEGPLMRIAAGDLPAAEFVQAKWPAINRDRSLFALRAAVDRGAAGQSPVG
jgi:hypothetical protein